MKANNLVANGTYLRWAGCIVSNDRAVDGCGRESDFFAGISDTPMRILGVRPEQSIERRRFDLKIQCHLRRNRA
jgi:hypothetical protein